MLTGTSGQTIFEIGLNTYPLKGLIFPIWFLTIGFLAIQHRAQKTDYKALRMLIIIVASLTFVLIQSNDIETFIKMRNSYLAGESLIVEGPVQNYQPAHYLQDIKESFTVQGVVFKYNFVEDRPCFHKSLLQHSLIHDGMNVRIYYFNYVKPCIMRIDILQK